MTDQNPEVVQPAHLVATEVPVQEPPKELTTEEKEKLEKQKKFFNYLRAGAAFIQFVEKDLENMRKQKMNRHFRRRAEKELSKGVLSPEVVNLYAEKMAEIVDYVDQQITPKIDGAELYKQLKEAEAKDKLTIKNV